MINISKILVVDDDYSIRKVLCEINEYFTGKYPDQADNYRTACEKIEIGKYDIIFSDLRMETSDAGLKLLEFCKNKQPGALFVLTSGNFSEEDLDAANVLGVDLVLEKPFSVTAIEEFFAIIN